MHLDKALTAPFAAATAVGLDGAIHAHRRIIEMDVNGHEMLVQRARDMLDRLLLRGVLAVRSHVNVGEGLGLLHLAAMLEAAVPFRHLMEIQIVAMAHTPLAGGAGAGNRALLRQALSDLQLDGIGGCPHLDADPEGALEELFAIAADTGLPLDLHTDETLDPKVFTVPSLARLTERANMQGRVVASHCVSLGMQPAEVQTDAARALASAGVGVVTLPQTNLFLNAVGVRTAPPRGLAPAAVLLDAGVVVAAGSDNLQDPFNPVGDADPLHTASLMVTAGHQLPDVAMAMVSDSGRMLMGLPASGPHPGRTADLVALPPADNAATIADCSADRMVFHRGRLVASTSVVETVFR
ncbi:MAG: hypothetical protein RI900_2531 [Actinomycetota bacterium]